MIRTISHGNLALAFALELAGLTAFGYWGVRTGSTGLSSAALGIATPVIAAILWGVFAAPRAPVHSVGAAVAVKVVFFLAATLALYVTAHPGLAATFLVLVALSSVLSFLEPGGNRLDRASHASDRTQTAITGIQQSSPAGGSAAASGKVGAGPEERHPGRTHAATPRPRSGVAVGSAGRAVGTPST